MIEANQLTKQFGTFTAVGGITMTVQPGEVLALLGPNGAGKTTTVRMLAAILQPTSGTARIAGLDVVQHAQEVRSRVGLLTEYPGLYGRMRAIEYLDFFGSLLGLDHNERTQRARSLLQQFGLWEARDKRLESYSKGMRQKLALVRALIHSPPVLFLDEPTTAMDPQSARTVRDAIGDLRAADRSILLTTHNLTEAELLADRIAIIRSGQIIERGTKRELMTRLLGTPLWQIELPVRVPSSYLRPLLADLIDVEDVTGTQVRYRTATPYAVNPHVIARLQQLGLSPIAVTEVSRSLEDVYLQIVSRDAPTDHVPSPAAASTERSAATPHARSAAASPHAANPNEVLP